MIHVAIFDLIFGEFYIPNRSNENQSKQEIKKTKAIESMLWQSTMEAFEVLLDNWFGTLNVSAEIMLNNDLQVILFNFPTMPASTPLLKCSSLVDRLLTECYPALIFSPCLAKWWPCGCNVYHWGIT